MTDEQPGTVPSLTYGDYLRLEGLLDCQQPLSAEHDEMLFIVVHHSTELWMKLMLHELRATRQHVRHDALPPAMKMLTRVARIQTQMMQAWDVLATMTPTEFMRFRHVLGESSGLQSHQYRLLEFMLGGKNRSHLVSYRDQPTAFAGLSTALGEPSLYDESLRLLARRGLPIPVGRLQRDWSQPYTADADVEAVWLTIYRAPEQFWELYDLAEKLVDLEYRFQKWRFAHLKTVERIIGFKRGTGGSIGIGYLQKVLERSFFPELMSLRTVM